MKRMPEDLERLIHCALRELPDRRAPRTLESRVLAEIDRRAELPWWRQPYPHWPAAGLSAFFVLSAAAAAVIVAGIFHLVRSPESAHWARAASQCFEWPKLLRFLSPEGWETAVGLWRAIPPLWFYGLLAALAASYATLIGIGAVAYRTFFAPTGLPRNFSP